MLLSLTILRGVDLLAMDYNLTKPNNSDPFCEVYVDDTTKMGWTPTRTQTLNPIWGGPMASFRFEGSGSTKITIQLWDYDTFKRNDAMGKVTFTAQDMFDVTIAGGGPLYPNTWATVTPPRGYKGKYAGKLQVRLLPVLNVSPDSRIQQLMKLPRIPPSGLKVGPELAAATTPSSPISKNDQTAVFQHMKGARTPVILHVYDVGRGRKIRALNQVLPTAKVGGVFHGGIEVYGNEYSFGYSPNRTRCGIFPCPPAECPLHTYRESIYLGDCQLTSKKQVMAVLEKMKPDWLAHTYHMLRKNCCFFSNEFAIELGVGAIPAWVYTLADVGAWANQVVSWKEIPFRAEPRSSFRRTFTSDEQEERNKYHHYVEDLTLSHVMAVRLQRRYRARRDEKALAASGLRRASWNVYEGHGFEIVDVPSLKLKG